MAAEQKRDGSTEEFFAFAEKVSVVGVPIGAAAFITRGAAYAIDPEYYSQKSKHSLIPSSQDTEKRNTDNKLVTNTTKHLGLGMIGVGVLIAASEIDLKRRMTRRMFLIKLGGALIGFAGAQFMNMTEEKVPPGT